MELNPMPKFFDRYIKLVEETNLLDALQKSLEEFENFDVATFNQLDGKRYAPRKWTIKEVFRHIIDTERIMVYRALRFARNDKTEIPGFDENSYNENANGEAMSFDDLRQEFVLNRKSNIILFRSFDEEVLNRKGVCSGIEITVNALGFMLAGHQKHHFNVVKERYLPLIQ
ncbi:MAG: DinB family protein [Flammeovirgaceae bacterium]|nr:DinB family protein [Flammeovirgaceae bacterium]